MMSTSVKSRILDVDWSAQTLLPIELNGEEVMLEARAYVGEDPDCQALALLNRNRPVGAEDAPLVRVHSGCVTGDVFQSLRCDCHQQLKAALQAIAETPNGVLIYLPYHEGRGIGLVNKIKAYAMQDEGLDTVDANVEIGAPVDARDYGLAAAILRDLDIARIRLLTNNPAKVEALKSQGIAIAEQLPIVAIPGSHNKRYLETKRTRMAHKL